MCLCRSVVYYLHIFFPSVYNCKDLNTEHFKIYKRICSNNILSLAGSTFGSIKKQPFFNH